MDDERRRPTIGPWRAAIIVNLAFAALASGGYLIVRTARTKPMDCTSAARPYGDIVFQRYTRRGYQYGEWIFKDGTFSSGSRIALAFNEHGTPVRSVACLDAQRVASGFQLTDEPSRLAG